MKIRTVLISFIAAVISSHMFAASSRAQEALEQKDQFVSSTDRSSIVSCSKEAGIWSFQFLHDIDEFDSDLVQTFGIPASAEPIKLEMFTFDELSFIFGLASSMQHATIDEIGLRKKELERLASKTSTLQHISQDLPHTLLDLMTRMQILKPNKHVNAILARRYVQAAVEQVAEGIVPDCAKRIAHLHSVDGFLKRLTRAVSTKEVGFYCVPSSVHALSYITRSLEGLDQYNKNELLPHIAKQWYLLYGYVPKDWQDDVAISAHELIEYVPAHKESDADIKDFRLNLSQKHLNDLTGLREHPKVKGKKALHLVENHITHLEKSPFDSPVFAHLKLLDLRYNGIITIDVNSFKGLDALRILDLSHNQLCSFNPEVSNLPSLLTINLIDNPLSNGEIATIVEELHNFEHPVKLMVGEDFSNSRWIEVWPHRFGATVSPAQFVWFDLDIRFERYDDNSILLNSGPMVNEFAFPVY